MLEAVLSCFTASAVVCMEKVFPVVSKPRVPPAVGCLFSSEFVREEMKGEEEGFSLSARSLLALLPLLLIPNSSQRSQPQSLDASEEEVLYMLKLSP